MSYDSLDETMDHINTVRRFLGVVVEHIKDRALKHDHSKVLPPEKEYFDKFTPMLRGTTYGSPEYKAALEGMKPALDHHYSKNRHHPEHFAHGIADMNLLDLIEMLADWKAATMRHDDGDLGRSITMNQQRFGYSTDLMAILQNTARDLDWL